MINRIDSKTNKCCVICRHCVGARGLSFSRTVALVPRPAHLRGLSARHSPPRFGDDHLSAQLMEFVP